MGQLVSELAHELNQPLYAAANFAEASLNLLKLETYDKADLQSWLQEVTMQVARMGQIVRHVAGFGNKTPPDPQPCKLNDLVHDCLHLIQLRCEKRRHKSNCH